MKRLLDLTIAGTTLLVLSPLLVMAAVGILLTSRGPILYRAERIGRDRRRIVGGRGNSPAYEPERRRRNGYWGRKFTMYKFRTMHVERGYDAGGPITRRDDPRIYPFGRFLRATKVDELPQLLNVVKGDMAMVGPRPEAPEIVRNHYGPAELETLRVAPGVTSPGTVYYYTHCESRLTADAVVNQYVQELLPIKLALDRVYIQRASVVYDLRIIIRTAASVVARLLGGLRFPEPPELREAQLKEWRFAPSRTSSRSEPRHTV